MHSDPHCSSSSMCKAVQNQQRCQCTLIHMRAQNSQPKEIKWFGIKEDELSGEEQIMAATNFKFHLSFSFSFLFFFSRSTKLVFVELMTITRNMCTGNNPVPKHFFLFFSFCSLSFVWIVEVNFVVSQILKKLHDEQKISKCDKSELVWLHFDQSEQQFLMWQTNNVRADRPHFLLLFLFLLLQNTIVNAF